MARKIKISVKGVSKKYPLEGNKVVHALDDFGLDIYENEFLAIVGPSGCGKSTLLFIIAGLLEPSSGSVYCDGVEIKGPSPKRGVVFQRDAVFPWLTVRGNVQYGPVQMNMSKKEVQRITDEYLDLVGLKEFHHMWPKELSGGMRKRVDLARALATDPDVLLMDEPFGALDVITRQNLQVELSRMFSGITKTVFLVTHDLEEAIFLADRVVVVTEQPGRIRKTINVQFSKPRDAGIKLSNTFIELRREVGSYIGS